jgi:hypothetical protein
MVELTSEHALLVLREGHRGGAMRLVARQWLQSEIMVLGN